MTFLNVLVSEFLFDWMKLTLTFAVVINIDKKMSIATVLSKINVDDIFAVLTTKMKLMNFYCILIPNTPQTLNLLLKKRATGVCHFYRHFNRQ